MAGFDASLDKEVFGESVEFDNSRIKVSVMCYNDGENKLQISRERMNPTTEEWGWAKLGRLTKEEVEKVIPLMEKVKENMN